MAETLRGETSAEVEVVRRSQDAWNRGDIDAMLDLAPPDVEWVIAQENPEARTLRGSAAIGAYLRDWRETIEGLYYEATEHRQVGQSVVTIGTATGRMGAEGPELAVPLCFVTRFEGGAPVRTEEYLDAEQALAAAGLR